MFRIASKHCREKLITFRSDADDTTGPADRLIRMVSVARIRELVSARWPSEEAKTLWYSFSECSFSFVFHSINGVESAKLILVIFSLDYADSLPCAARLHASQRSL